MKKRILGLGIAASVVIALVASGTWAIFTDTETTTGNTFTAGTIDISLDPTEGQAVATVEGDLDLKPCQTGYIGVNVTNDGTNPAEIWKHIANVENREHGIVDAEAKFYAENAGSENWLLSNWIHYDMIICSYSEECFDETDFTHVQDGDEPASEYLFDVCLITEGGMAKWILDIDGATTPSLSHSAVQLVISTDGGATPDFNMGCSSESDPMYKPYNGSWGSATSVLPDGMSVTGNCGDTHFEIEIPMSYLDCPDFHWAMNVEADYAGTNGSSQYRWASGSWNLVASDYFPASCNCTEEIAESEGFFLTGPTWPVECFYIYLGLLEPGESMFVIQSYHLDIDVDNWGQSDRVFFDMEFLAQQSEGSPPPPTPELINHGKPQ